MAGAGRRTFQPGEVLTASNVNSYLMDQSVMRFADSTARGSAVGTAVISEGMVSYLDDVNALEFYDGASWTRFAAGSGLPIANGGTGGTTVAAAQANLQIVAVQTLQDEFTTMQVNNSSTYVDTGLEITITPKYSDSKILVFATHMGCIKSPGNANSALNIRLLRSGTQILEIINAGFNGSSSDNRFGSVILQDTDDPGVNTAITYKTQFRNAFNGVGVSIDSGSMIVIEVRP